MNAEGTSPISLKQYYTSARGITTAVAAVAAPFVSKVVGADSKIDVFPPLGEIESTARLGLLVLCISVSLGVYFLAAVKTPKSPSRLIWIGTAAGLICMIAYLAACQAFVRRVDIPSRNVSVHISVGYERTPFALQTFGQASDWTMLQARGTDEEQIQRLWTARSVIVARLTLFLSCAHATASFLFVFSFGLAHDISNQPRAKK